MLLACMLAATMTETSPFSARAADWRNGPVVYQVFVDRFVPSTRLEAKRDLYAAPRSLRPWNETPAAGRFDPVAGCWTHELEFWGGDLLGVQSKLGYIRELGADVLYFLPIHDALTNHKYDARDYFAIAPEYGTREEFLGVVKEARAKGLRVMMDGVFNHVGKTNPIFEQARSNPQHPRRDWFFFDAKNGYRGWAMAGNLPALNLENPAVANYLWRKPDSVVQKLVKDVDGWRLDVAFELGPKHLAEIKSATHRAKKGSWVVGEIAGYPAGWQNAVDGVFNFFAVNVAKQVVEGGITGGQAGVMWDDMVSDAGIDTILKSWLLTDNHDTARLASEIPDPKSRRLVQFLQLTLPGSPVLYYGSELGMAGAGDPQNRAPMRWDLANDANPDYAWIKKLLEIRQKHRSLRFGDFTSLRTEKLVAFQRTTDKLDDLVVVVANPTGNTVREHFPLRVGRVMSWGLLTDVLNGGQTRVITGLLNIEMAPRSARVYVFDRMEQGGFSPYHRIDG